MLLPSASGVLLPPQSLGGQSIKTKRVILDLLDLMEICLDRLYFFFPVSPFGMGVSLRCLSHHSILEAHYLGNFTGTQLERNFASG